MPEPMVKVYECQLCEERFADPLTVMVVYRYDTARLQNGSSFIITYEDMVMVCPDCHGAYQVDTTKVGFTGE